MRNFPEASQSFRKSFKSSEREESKFSLFSEDLSDHNEEKKDTFRTPAVVGVSQKLEGIVEKNVSSNGKGNYLSDSLAFTQPYTTSTEFESDLQDASRSSLMYFNKKCYEHRDLREHLFSSDAGVIKFSENVTLEHIRALNWYITDNKKRFSCLYFEQFCKYFKTDFVEKLSKFRDQNYFPKFTTHFFPNSNKEFLFPGHEISLTISVNAIYNPYYILNKIFSLINSESGPAHLRLLSRLSPFIFSRTIRRYTY